MNPMRGGAIACLLFCCALPGFGRLKPERLLSSAPVLQAANNSAGAPAQIRFSYENSKLQPSQYVLTIREDGSGRYQSEASTSPSTDQSDLPTVGQDRAIQISSARRAKIFAAARRSKYFNISCDTGDSHLAFQGTKTLAYDGADGHGNCTYNWSKDKQIDMLTSEFQGIALTLETGARLEIEYLHSRLRLDAELDQLSQLVQQGQAIELANIAPCLQKIAGDDAILHTAQRRARELLKLAKAE